MIYEKNLMKKWKKRSDLLNFERINNFLLHAAIICVEKEKNIDSALDARISCAVHDR